MEPTMPAAKKIALTDKALRAMKPAPDGRRLTTWDAMLPGLAVRVGAKGRPAFYVVRRRAGDAQPSWVKIGEYPVTGLAEAREAARSALGALMAGDDPAAVAEAKRREKEDARRAREEGVFRAVAERFIAEHVARQRTAREGAALIRRELIPVLGDKNIGDIRRRDVIRLVDAIVGRAVRRLGAKRVASGGEYAARHALKALKKLFNWAIAKDISGLEQNPANLVKVTEEGPKPRQRVLTDAELRRVWEVAGTVGYPFGPLLRALILTGQRRSEIAEAAWSEIEGDMLTIPATRMKNKQPHVVPLTPQMRELIAALPRFAGGEFMFSTQGGRRPFSGFSKAKARLDRLLGDGVTGWTLHDLRRTVRTGLAAAGVPVFDAELIVAHRQTGVHGVYDVHRYDAEKLGGLIKWEARLARIVAPEPAPDDTVVPMRARA
jgi:integrase